MCVNNFLLDLFIIRLADYKRVPTVILKNTKTEKKPISQEVINYVQHLTILPIATAIAIRFLFSRCQTIKRIIRWTQVESSPNVLTYVCTYMLRY